MSLGFHDGIDDAGDRRTIQRGGVEDGRGVIIVLDRFDPVAKTVLGLVHGDPATRHLDVHIRQSVLDGEEPDQCLGALLDFTLAKIALRPAQVQRHPGDFWLLIWLSGASGMRLWRED